MDGCMKITCPPCVLLTLLTLTALWLSGCSEPATETSESQPKVTHSVPPEKQAEARAELASKEMPSLEDIVSATKKAHGIDRWDQADSLKADVVVNFGDKTMAEGTFTFQAHGPKARYDMSDDTVVVFDGQTAWVTPAEKADPMKRFHVLTWPWFLMSPFKIEGEGIKLSDMRPHVMQGKEYISVLQEFEDGTGDTPDDWYRLFISPRNYSLRAMSYIVTYGKDKNLAEEQASIVLHEGFTDVEGAEIPSEFEFWYWDHLKGEFVGDSPKGTAVATNIAFIEPEAGFYDKPEGAVEVALPQAAAEAASKPE